MGIERFDGGDVRFYLPCVHGFAAGGADAENGDADKTGKQQQPFDAVDVDVEGCHADKEDGDGGQKRQLAPHKTSGDGQRGDEAGNAQDETEVGDVAADDIADGNVAGFAVECSGEADDQFGHTGAKGDDGEADDDWRQVESHGQARGSAHEKFSPAHQEHKPS